MKKFSGLFIFLVVFALSGILIHQALYNQLGIFVWSLQEDPETGGKTFARTTMAPATVEVESEPEEPAAGVAATEEVLESAPAPEAIESKEEDPGEISLFNGKDLGEWEITRFGGEGDVFVDEEGNLELGFGAVMTGVNWGGEPPSLSNYEIEFEAMKLDGYDFFCALTFPVKESHATYVLGGWGGGVVGISSVDDLNASENETMNIEGFENDRWYRIMVRVTDDKLEAWLDDDKMVNLPLKDRKISLLPGDIELSVPIGIASFQTRSQFRNIVWRNLAEAE
ncbi:MAG: family 16 glycoside hydrolase [Verrucomicrobiota bacterium]